MYNTKAKKHTKIECYQYYPNFIYTHRPITVFEKFSKVQLKHEMKSYLPSCDNTVKYNAAFAGALTVVTLTDRFFVGMGIPRPVHWALAGYAANQLCQGELGSSAFQWEGPAWGVGGGLAAAFLLA